MSGPKFDLNDFLPYLLNQAAESTARQFSTIYRERYGMLRTEWRVLFHLGHHGDMTAKQVGTRSRDHKTKISRAVGALEKKRLLKREPLETDRRHEMLRLTPRGRVVFLELSEIANDYNKKILLLFTREERKILQKCLHVLHEI